MSELMLIEKSARKPIFEAVEIAKRLISFETSLKMQGKIMLSSNAEYNSLRKELISSIAYLNSVSNIEGKGRIDLNIEILLEAEDVLRKVSNEQSIAIRVLAYKIRKSFENLRNFFIQNEEKIESFDPQFKNNKEFVDLLYEYERNWEKGQEFLINREKFRKLMFFSHIFEITAEKHVEFHDFLQARDSIIFLIIPSLLILNKLDKNDHEICKIFLPQIEQEGHKLERIYQQLQRKFDVFKSKNAKSYKYFNIMEKQVIGIKISKEKEGISNEDLRVVEEMTHVITGLAMELERNNPVQWNRFLEVALIEF